MVCLPAVDLLVCWLRSLGPFQFQTIACLSPTVWAHCAHADILSITNHDMIRTTVPYCSTICHTIHTMVCLGLHCRSRCCCHVRCMTCPAEPGAILCGNRIKQPNINPLQKPNRFKSTNPWCPAQRWELQLFHCVLDLIWRCVCFCQMPSEIVDEESEVYLLISLTWVSVDHLMTCCSPDDLLLTWWPTAHLMTHCSPDDPLLTWWPTAHLMTRGSPADLLLTCWPAAHLMTCCSLIIYMTILYFCRDFNQRGVYQYV